MSRLPALLLLAVAVSACSLPGAPKRSQAQVDSDGRTVATAIASADRDGSSFHMDETLQLHGGDIPSNQQLSLKSSADGSVHDGRAQMTYRIFRSNNQTATYDIVLTENRVYVRPRGRTAWRYTTAANATALYPALRLPLLRESVLLASNVGEGSITTVGNGLATRYRVTPASAQMEQLMAIPVAAAQQSTFLKTAKAQIDAYLTVTGGKLSRLALTLQGTDQSTGEVQNITSTADFRPAKVNPISEPSGAAQVEPSQLLSP